MPSSDTSVMAIEINENQKYVSYSSAGSSKIWSDTKHFDGGNNLLL